MISQVVTPIIIDTATKGFTAGIKALEDPLVQAPAYPYVRLYKTCIAASKHKYEARYSIYALIIATGIASGIILPFAIPQLMEFLHRVLPFTAANPLLVVFVTAWFFGSTASVLGAVGRTSLLLAIYGDDKYFLRGSRIRYLSQELGQSKNKRKSKAQALEDYNRSAEEISNLFKYLLDLHNDGKTTIEPRTEQLSTILDMFMYASAHQVSKYFKFYAPFYDAQLADDDPKCILTSEANLLKLSKKVDLSPDKISKIFRHCLKRIQDHDTMLDVDDEKRTNPLKANRQTWLAIIYEIMNGSDFICQLAILQAHSTEFKHRRLISKFKELNKLAAEGIEFLQNVSEASPRSSITQDVEEEKQEFITGASALTAAPRSNLPPSLRRPSIRDSGTPIYEGRRLSDLALKRHNVTPAQMNGLETSARMLVEKIARQSDTPEEEVNQLIDPSYNNVTYKGLEVAKEYLQNEMKKLEHLEEIPALEEDEELANILQEALEEKISPLEEVKKSTPLTGSRTLQTAVRRFSNIDEEDDLVLPELYEMMNQVARSHESFTPKMKILSTASSPAVPASHLHSKKISAGSMLNREADSAELVSRQHEITQFANFKALMDKRSREKLEKQHQQKTPAKTTKTLPRAQTAEAGTERLTGRALSDQEGSPRPSKKGFDPDIV